MVIGHQKARGASRSRCGRWLALFVTDRIWADSLKKRVPFAVACYVMNPPLDPLNKERIGTYEHSIQPMTGSDYLTW